MYFTSRCAQDEYTSNVLYDFERVDILRELASTLMERMFELTNGRSWMAAHIRRGDCRFPLSDVATLENSYRR